MPSYNFPTEPLSGVLKWHLLQDTAIYIFHALQVTLFHRECTLEKKYLNIRVKNARGLLAHVSTPPSAVIHLVEGSGAGIRGRMWTIGFGVQNLGQKFGGCTPREHH